MKTYLFSILDKIPQYKAWANQFIIDLMKKAIDLGSSSNIEYFKIQRRRDLSLKEKNELLNKYV